MRPDVLEFDPPLLLGPDPLELTREDVSAIRLVLTGGSVIDWASAAFDRLEDVDAFLLRHRIDLGQGDDRLRLRYVFNEAVSYLEEHMRLRFPVELRAPEDIRAVFLWASKRQGFRRRQILSCVILKLMHVIHHMEAADLRFKTPISQEDLYDFAEGALLADVNTMRDAGLPITSFYGSRKTRASVVTKLLAKRENVAAAIYDKLRFRIVVRHRSDLVPTLRYMVRHLFPYNYVIPGESHNNLVAPEDLLAHAPGVAWEDDGTTPRLADTTKNEFSGASYRMINFIVDYPVALPASIEGGFGFEYGRVVYERVELQLLDEETAQRNEEGENSHELYKQRQFEVVNRRLKRGGARRGAGQD